MIRTGLDRSEESTMTEPMKQRWEDVGQRFEALGRAVKERYQSAEHAPGETPAAEHDEASQERAALREAFEKIVTAAHELGERAASIIHDPAVKEQTTLVARSLNDALTASVDQIGDEVGKLLKRTKGGGSSQPPTGPEGPSGG
jgi:hypothetical protein